MLTAAAVWVNKRALPHTARDTANHSHHSRSCDVTLYQRLRDTAGASLASFSFLTVIKIAYYPLKSSQISVRLDWFWQMLLCFAPLMSGSYQRHYCSKRQFHLSVFQPPGSLFVFFGIVGIGGNYLSALISVQVCFRAKEAPAGNYSFCKIAVQQN